MQIAIHFCTRCTACIVGDDAKYEEIWSRVSTQVDSNAEDDNGQASFNDFVAFMAAERADAGTKDDLLEQFEILSGASKFYGMSLVGKEYRKPLPRIVRQHIFIIYDLLLMCACNSKLTPSF